MVVARREIQQILRSKNLLISAVAFVVVFGAISTPAVIIAAENPAVILDQLGFYLVLTLGIFCGYIFSGQAFLREKTEGVIETLLCSPLSLRQLWLGKVTGVTIPAYVMALATAVIIAAGSSAILEHTVIYSPQVIVHILIVIPAFIAAASGLIGFAQLLLGMRENQILNFGIIMGLIFVISFTREVIGPTVEITWPVLLGTLLVAGALLALTFWLVRFLDRERIVTTLPE
jgi:ABC-2 type transport system permease protein